MSFPEERLWHVLVSLLISLSLYLSLCLVGRARKGSWNLFMLTPNIPTAV